MLRADSSIRFTPQEVDDFRSLGIDLHGVRTQDGLEQSLAAWANALSQDRPDLLEKIALEMARQRGVKPPVKLLLQLQAGQ